MIMNWKKTAIIGTAAIGAALLFAGCGGSGNEQAASDGNRLRLLPGWMIPLHRWGSEMTRDNW